MIATFQGTDIHLCAIEANKWLENEGCTYRVSNTQIFKIDEYNMVLVLTCESWYKISKYTK